MTQPSPYEAFCIGAQICFTDCDDTCPPGGACADLCHELTKPEAEQAHSPVDCPSAFRSQP
ncbi:hypothetical protein [Streptomyces sp. NPDC056049]|uniref:hypothetical protein n=1 Tax=Streptomyces sp. NPDC056049 TaxID=3345693 RepID=UPI0035DD7F43